MNLIQRLGLNPNGKTYACGDIHGEYDLFEEALDKIGFNKSKDRMICAGDLGDRGADSHKSIEYIVKDWFYAVQGNHEDMAIRYTLRMWPTDNFIQNGGLWLVGMTPDEQEVYRIMYQDLPYAIEVETPNGKVGIVHAECPWNDWNTLVEKLESPKTPEEFELTLEQILWNRYHVYDEDSNRIVKNVLATIHGHTINEKPVRIGNSFYIDTGAYYFKKKKGVNNLCIMDLDDLEIVHGPN